MSDYLTATGTTYKHPSSLNRDLWRHCEVLWPRQRAAGCGSEDLPSACRGNGSAECPCPLEAHKFPVPRHFSETGLGGTQAESVADML